MSVNPYPKLPQDVGFTAMQEYPAPKLAQARYANENATASSVITVSPNTTTLEVAAVGGAAIFRWVPLSDTQGSVVGIAGATANYDHVISKDTIRRFAIPIEGLYQAPSSFVGNNIDNGLYRRFAIKAAALAGPSSVLVSEF